MKKLITVFKLVFTAHLVSAQVNVGSIAFLGFQADAPDAFAFVTLHDFNAGDSIFFTDAGWNGTQFFSNEGLMRWKSDQFTPAGSVVRIQDPNNASIPNALIEGPGLTVGKMSSLTLAGDQLFAYTLNSSGNQIPIAAFSTNAFISVCDLSSIGNTPRSCLPSNLTLGLNAIQLNDNAPASANPNNAFFNQISVIGTPEEIATIVNNPSNWNTDEDVTLAGYEVWPAWQFSVGSIGNVEVGFLTNVFALTEGGNPLEVQISINPVLNLPKSITLQLELFDGIEASDLISNPDHINGTIQLEIPANISVFSFTIAAAANDGTEGNENGTLRIISVDEGLIISEDSLVDFSIIENLQSSFVSFSNINTNETFVEGDAFEYLLTFSPTTESISSLTIDFQSNNGFNESDYSSVPTAFSNAITFEIPAGTSSFPLSFASIDDSEVEPSENLQISIGELSSNLQAGVSTQVNLTFADNDIPVTYQNLNINEIMVNNTVTISDGFSEYDDWIEIQNAGLSSVSLANLYITNDPLVPNKFQFSASPLCSLAPSSFKLIWADDSIEQGPLHLNFELNNSGGFVGLYSLQLGTFGNFYALIDSVYYPAMGVDLSYAFYPNLAANWLLSDYSTPGLPNEYPLTTANETLDGIAVFPNPASEQVQILLKDLNSETDISVYSSAGKLVYSVFRNQNDLIAIQTETWPAGIYLVQIISNDRIVKRSVCVSK